MKKLSKTIIAVGACQIATSCASLPEVAHERDDAVAIALANGGCIDATSLKWTREPAGFSVQGIFGDSNCKFHAEFSGIV